MDISAVQSFLVVLVVAFIGGVAAKFLRLPTFVGYIAAGIVAGPFMEIASQEVRLLSEIGIILLLFSVGLELSLERLVKVGRIVLIGACFQMVLTTLITLFFLKLWAIDWRQGLILSLGFSLSSTALVVKILESKGDMESIHGRIMVGWLLVQDFAVVPTMAVLPILRDNSDQNFFGVLAASVLVVGGVVLAGRSIAPFLTRIFKEVNSRELLMLGSVIIALGTSFLVFKFGLSPALGAFLAGVVISETQENHAIFSETKRLRDLFVILFFSTLGFFILPGVLVAQIPKIVVIFVFVLLVKAVIVAAILSTMHYKGKTLVTVSLGLTQIGEFSFIVYLAAESSGILSRENSSIGIAAALLSLIATPFLFSAIPTVWRKLRKYPFLATKKVATIPETRALKDHIILCGYGRMGRWIGRALDREHIAFVVIDYNQKALNVARVAGKNTVFGDLAEPIVLENAGIKDAKAIVIAIPDAVSVEEVISYAQTYYPKLPIFARAHFDEEVSMLLTLGAKKVIQPEFEGALRVVHEIYKLFGKRSLDTKKKVSVLKREKAISI